MSLLLLLAGGAAAPVPVWTTPADTANITTTPTLAFTIPALGAPMHFYLQLDTANTFDTGNLRAHDSSASQTSWEYWDGDSWEAVPSTGVTSGYAGNDARFTVTTPLSPTGTWYRHVRAGT
jgi:uncharacterized membrane protein YoaK (UPF0700 family)